MKHHLALAVIVANLGAAAVAEEPKVFATYHADNCCLPPEYALNTSVTIFENGRVTLKQCTGYATEGPDCKTHRSKVSLAALTAIPTAAKASGLARKPAALNPNPAVGGGGRSGVAMLDGVAITLPRDPAVDDADRVARVMQAIRAALPAKFDRFLED